MQKYDIKKIIAFTLAEVLITLGIIGLVAEMTIPTLINNVNEAQYYAGAKKAYSTLSQALLMIASDPNLMMDTTDQNTTRDSFLNVMRTMGQGTDTQLMGSTPYYDYKCPSSGHTLNFSQAASYGSDSGILIVFPLSNCNNISNGTCSELYYDTNGLAKPNMSGYDFISFLLLKKNGVYQVKPKGMPGSGDGYSCSLPACNGEMTSDGCGFNRIMGMPMP